MRRQLITALVSFLLLPSSPVAALTYTNQFHDWYPQYGHIFEDIKNVYCADEYSDYLTRNKSHTKIDIIGGGGIYSVLTQPVINCILNHTSDYVKNGMTSAQVLLGIMPTVLAFLGASTEEMSMLANVARRPFLALLLSAGSPSVYFSRAFEYHGPGEILAVHELRMRQWRPSTLSSQLLVSGTEYLFAILAFVNIAVINWQLGVRTICAFWTDSILAPMLWACLGVVTHIIGTFILRLRLQGWRGTPKDVRGAAEMSGSDTIITTNSQNLETGLSRRATYYIRQPSSPGFFHPIRRLGLWVRGIPRRVWDMRKTEFLPSSAACYNIRIMAFVETRTFLIAAWVLSMLTIFNVVFGTLVFASTTFIGTRDALEIVAKYIGSAAVCRIVLMYELAGLREACYQELDREGVSRESSVKKAGEGKLFSVASQSVELR